ncbi:hypothetical protein U1Q18_007213 [Sarracenia purpurea var. burkii]
MKKKKPEVEDDDHDLEILKAVAQAWYGRSGSSRTTTEFDALRLNFKNKPSRFKLEATNNVSTKAGAAAGAHWDFGQSLWDSYEIVSVSKRLESGLVLDHQFSELDDPTLRRKRRKESKNSLRSLMKVSSRKFNGAKGNSSREEGT